MDDSGSVVILTGGTSRRMGHDKAAVDFGGIPLLEFVVGLIPPGNQIVVVGEPTDVAATYVREQPAGGGPVAALHAALPLIAARSLRVVAVDTPFGLPWLLQHRLPPGREALIPKDSLGRPHYLCAQYTAGGIATAIAAMGGSHGASMKELVSQMSQVEYVENPHTDKLTSTEVLLDINTPVDLLHARTIHARTIRDREWGD